jgi:hypothetical protein
LPWSALANCRSRRRAIFEMDQIDMFAADGCDRSISDGAAKQVVKSSTETRPIVSISGSGGVPVA